MKYNIAFSKTFEKNLKKLTSTEQKQVAEKLKTLQRNPFYPSLRTKIIKGFQNLFECSVNMDIRILWRYKGTKIILTLDIGRHSILDKL